MKPCNHLLTKMLSLAVGGMLTAPAVIADTAFDTGFLQCFYECKVNQAGTFFTEQTTLMIMNGDQGDPAVGDITTRVAHLAFINGNERIIGRTQVNLSPRDLDELNVCATLLKGGVAPLPSAGIVQVAIGTPTAPGQFIPARDVDIAIKNPVGSMPLTNPEVFQGKITGVGKTSCSEVESDPGRLFFDPKFQQAPPLQPVLIEGTEDPVTPVAQ